MSADDHFGNNDRYPDGHDAENEEEHKGPAAVHAGDIGELPDVAQAHGGTGRCHDEAETARPESTFWGSGVAMGCMVSG